MKINRTDQTVPVIRQYFQVARAVRNTVASAGPFGVRLTRVVMECAGLVSVATVEHAADMLVKVGALRRDGDRLFLGGAK